MKINMKQLRSFGVIGNWPRSGREVFFKPPHSKQVALRRFIS